MVKAVAIDKRASVLDTGTLLCDECATARNSNEQSRSGPSLFEERWSFIPQPGDVRFL
jgi:hypothetical protein